MAEHRMLSRSVISSDRFLDLPATAQILYIHIGINADDDGFTDRLNSIRRQIGAKQEDVQSLVSAGFIYVFDSGITVDMYWNINNSIRKDRRKPTVHQTEMQMLTMVDNGMYTLKPSDNQMSTTCQPSDNQMSAQDKISKEKLSKENHPSNLQTTSCNSISGCEQKPVDNSAPDKTQNAEPELDKPRSGSLDGWNLKNFPQGDEYALSPPDAFKAFREAYPRKQGTLRDVQTAWVNATEVGHVLPGDLVYAARKYARTCSDEKTDQRYIKMPQNFISSGLWKSYVPKYLPSCPHCHGQGIYEDSGRMVQCNCDRRYGP